MCPVTEYATAVVSGDIVAGLYVRLACRRHLDDLEKQDTDAFPYIFDEEKAQLLIDFAETLRYTGGKKGFAGTNVQLHGFAKFILGSIFGWVHRDSGYRRFLTAYIQVARKNIKSMLLSIIVIWMCGFDGYEDAQVYCTATKMRQARIVWRQASKFISKDPFLREYFKIREHDAEIEHIDSGGRIMALGRDTGTIDGFEPVCGIVDEYHAHKTNQMYKLLEDGAVNLEEYLIGIITTAGFDLNSPCFEEYEYCCSSLDTSTYNDSNFIYIAQLDKDDDIWDENNWIKANPLVATLPQGLANLRRFAEKAKKKGGSDLRNFKTKSLNIWTQMSDNPLIKKFEDWKRGGEKYTLEDMRGKSCFVGLDLSKGGDLTSLALEFPLIDGEKKAYFFHSHSFMPSKRLEEHIEEDNNAPYDVWRDNGLLTITEASGGVKTDYKAVITHLEDLQAEYGLTFLAIAYDPYNADAFLSDLENFGVPLIEVRQTFKVLSEATEDFRLEVEAGNVFYDKGNKLLTWSINNAVVVSNSYSEIKIDKMSQRNRIDPVDAAIDCHVVAISKAVYVHDANEFADSDLLDKLWG
ncbi:MAG: terminase large subunit [Defluviitaleaceae bacterium]|nr:terminase large subunit [Defluviitaleaceae bacterium]